MVDQPPFVADLHPRIATGKFALGTWLTLLDPAVPELIAGAGFDLVIVDGEHGPAATADLARTLIATRASGVPLLFRVGANEPVRIMHALDAGASGVVVPQIRTVADAERAVAWCRYPPDGLRGIAPRRASGYGRGTAAYMAGANATVTCCIQIETREALADLDAILAVPGVDTILIGPNDLAAALGHIGDLAHAGGGGRDPPRRRSREGGRRPGGRLGRFHGAGSHPPRAGLRLGDRRLRLRLHGRGRRRRGPGGRRGLIAGRAGEVEGPVVAAQDVARRVLELGRPEQREPDLAADAVRCAVVHRREGMDRAYFPSAAARATTRTVARVATPCPWNAGRTLQPVSQTVSPSHCFSQ